jgi:hypothetical protein
VRALIALGLTHVDAGDLGAGEKVLREGLQRGVAMAERRTTRTALAGLARIAAEAGAPETAVPLFAYVDDLGATLDIPASEASMGRREARLVRLRSELGDDAFNEAWERGRGLTMEEAIDLALAAPATSGA